MRVPQLRIRDRVVDPPLVLAPMEGVTDLTFRRLVRTIGGCGLTVTEFVPASGLSLNLRKAREMTDLDPDEHPVSIQIFGRDPDTMGTAAAIVQDLGADVVDLNMGCPSKRVCARSGGSALMKEPELVRRIVASMRAAVSIPLTVKMRAGWDEHSHNAPEIAHICESEGAELAAVHWRTRADRYGGTRNLDIIRAVKDRVRIPVLANGDVVDVASAADTLERTGADGLMIGRGAIKDPWVFLRIQRAMQGLPPLEVSWDEKERVLLSWFEQVRSRSRTDHGALGRFKKIASYFFRGMGDLRQRVLRSQSPEEAIAIIRGVREAA